MLSSGINAFIYWKKTNLVPHDRAIYSRENVGSDYIGWLHFQPVIDKLITQEKDMFD